MTGRGMARILLACAVAGLAGVVAKISLDVIDVSAIEVVDAPPAERSARASEAAVPPLADLRSTRERPLFAPTRRPAVAVAETQAEEARRLALVGMMRPSGRAGRALIRVDGARTALWVGEGAEVAGYVVQSIAADGVTVERGGRRLVLTLRPARTAQD